MMIYTDKEGNKINPFVTNHVCPVCNEEIKQKELNTSRACLRMTGNGGYAFVHRTCKTGEFIPEEKLTFGQSCKKVFTEMPVPMQLFILLLSALLIWACVYMQRDLSKIGTDIDLASLSLSRDAEDLNRRLESIQKDNKEDFIYTISEKSGIMKVSYTFKGTQKNLSLRLDREGQLDNIFNNSGSIEVLSEGLKANSYDYIIDKENDNSYKVLVVADGHSEIRNFTPIQESNIKGED